MNVYKDFERDPSLTCVTDFATEDEALAYARKLITEEGEHVVEVHHSILGWEVWA